MLDLYLDWDDTPSYDHLAPYFVADPVYEDQQPQLAEDFVVDEMVLPIVTGPTRTESFGPSRPSEYQLFVSRRSKWSLWHSISEDTVRDAIRKRNYVRSPEEQLYDEHMEYEKRYDPGPDEYPFQDFNYGP